MTREILMARYTQKPYDVEVILPALAAEVSLPPGFDSVVAFVPEPKFAVYVHENEIESRFVMSGWGFGGHHGVVYYDAPGRHVHVPVHWSGDVAQLSFPCVPDVIRPRIDGSEYLLTATAPDAATESE